MRAPAITVVGAVAALAEQLAWLAPRPLAGRSVAVTRARAQASGLARRLRARRRRGPGAGDPDRAAARQPPLDLAPYDLVCLTSPNGVDALFERLVDAPADGRARAAGARVAAIGPGTARALASTA